MNGGRERVFDLTPNIEKIKNVWVPLISALTALLAIFFGIFSQYLINTSNFDVKVFEITYLEKRKAYSELMAEIDQYMYTALPGKTQEHGEVGFRMEKNYYLLLPFIKESDLEVVDKKYRDTVFLINATHSELMGKTELTPNQYMSALLKNAEVQERKNNLSKLLLKLLFNEKL